MAPQLQWLRITASEKYNGWAQKCNLYRSAAPNTGKLFRVGLESSRPKSTTTVEHVHVGERVERSNVEDVSPFQECAPRLDVFAVAFPQITQK